MCQYCETVNQRGKQAEIAMKLKDSSVGRHMSIETKAELDEYFQDLAHRSKQVVVGLITESEAIELIRN